jgi:hypothetical protein
LNCERVCSKHETPKEEKKVTRNPVSEVLELLPRIELLLRKDIYENEPGQRVRII